MQKVLENIEDDNLRATIVWMPILRSDNRKAAEKRVGEFSDKRLTYFWDGDRLTGKLWKRVLEIKGVAWDVYFLYGALAKWKDDAPPKPDFWMHQLRVKKAHHLNREKFEVKTKELLKKEVKSQSG